MERPRRSTDYRRDTAQVKRNDSEGEAGRLFDDLTSRFGPEAVFVDVAAIEPTGRSYPNLALLARCRKSAPRISMGTHISDSRERMRSPMRSPRVSSRVARCGPVTIPAG